MMMRVKRRVQGGSVLGRIDALDTIDGIDFKTGRVYRIDHDRIFLLERPKRDGLGGAFEKIDGRTAPEPKAPRVGFLFESAAGSLAEDDHFTVPPEARSSGERGAQAP